MGTKEILNNIIQEFNTKKLVHLFRDKTRTFRLVEQSLDYYNDDNFSDCENYGAFKLENDLEMAVFTAHVKKELSERSGKKAQYALGKKFLKDTQRYIGGFFIFYDDKNDFRFSLIYDIPLATGKRDWSNFRRYTYFVSKDQTNKTFINQFTEADFSTLEKIIDAFSVEKVTKEFFEAYRYALNDVIIASLKNYNVDYKLKHSFAQQLLSRILFIYFLQRKGWLKWKNYEQDKNYIRNLWLKYKNLSKNKNTFYSHWLSSLFFGAFNKKNQFIKSELPDEIKESFTIMPFLNGGLFAKNEFDELNFEVPDRIFQWLFEPDPNEKDKRKGFLEIFNFTIYEASLDDAEVAVDPEMLGKVYESLIAEEERGDAGIFYTPRIEIDFMCRLSLINYLHSKTKISKEELTRIIFNPDEIHSYKNIENLKLIRRFIESAKVVDPAVGSASFLVGMMNILVELRSLLVNSIEKRDVNLFDLKKEIILHNLYGVDVKDWAVMVGELRLWLSLMIETDEKFMNIYNTPLLPNLTFKIRQGDSLVEDIAGVFINLRSSSFKQVPESIQRKIRELIDKKSEFFRSQRSADLKEIKEIENFEKDIFREILQTKLNELYKTLSSRTQALSQLANDRNLFGEKSDKSRKELKKLSEEIEQLQNEINKYQNALSTIGTNGKKDYFLWELDFAEVFATNGGFDIVFGNPPYVRQELVAPPLENEDDYSPDYWRELKKEYKDKLFKAVQSVWKDVKKIDKKSDLYVYFYYQGLSLLNDGGIFCFINSNSWLDVGYGAGLQEFLLKNMKPINVIDNISKRSFKQADVNTVIVLIQKPEQIPNDFTLKFIAFKRPFEEVINPEILNEIEKADRPVFDNPNYRIYPKSKMELLEEGVEYPEDTELKLESSAENLPYIGNKWGGKYLRAPEIYFKILEKGKDKLVRLGDIAEVRFGIKTGANEFFYLKPVGKTVKEVVEISEKNPDTLIEVKNGTGWQGEIEAEFLKPVIKSPRELKTIMVRLEDLNYLVLMCHKQKKELKGKKVLDYILWGEKQKFHLRPTCKGRTSWWDLGERETGDLSYSYVIGEIHKIPINQKFYVDCNLFDIILKTNESFCIAYFLNSAVFRLFLELAGREMTGALTVLKVQVFELEKQFVLLPNYWKIDLPSFDKFSKRIISSLITELGFNPVKPIREQEPNPLPDRKALDDIVFDALGLTEEERKEVYWAVAELVKARLDKAKSV
jgi:hypothetical protein